MVKKRAPKSIPPSLKELYKNGSRVRFHGWWMGESEMDRAIADWLDNLPEREASAIIKTILYTYITGRFNAPIDFNTVGRVMRDDDELGEIEKTLGELED